MTQTVYFVKYKKEKNRLYLFDHRRRFIASFTSSNINQIKKYIKEIANKEELYEAIKDFISFNCDKDKLVLKYFYDEDFMKLMKSYGGIWDKNKKAWIVKTEVIDVHFAREVYKRYKKLYGEEIKEVLKEILERNSKVILKSKASKGKIEVRIPIGKRLFPFQIAGVEYLLEKDGKVILGDSMGLGKTVQAITFLNAKEDVFPVLIVCPANIRYKWEDSLNEWLIKDATIVHLKSRTPKLEKRGDIYIINYDILPYWEDVIKTLGIRTLIFDEAHYVKNPRAKRTKAIYRISQDAKYRIAITGTPITNVELYEIYTLCKIVRPDIFRNYRVFEERFKNDLQGLNKFLRQTLLIRRLKKEVMKELPEKIRVPLKVEVDMSKFKEIEEEIIEKIRELKKEKGELEERDIFAILLPLFDKHRQISGLLKIEHTVKLVNQILDEGEKAVVFAHHKEVIKELVNKVKSETNANVYVITGDTPQERRYEIAKEFNSDKDRSVFIASIQACSEGIDLQSASYVIFNQIDWNPAKNIQAEDRVHRIGQKKNVTSYWVIAKDTIDEHIVNKLIQKLNVIDKVVGSEDKGVELSEVSKKWTQIMKEIFFELFKSI